MDSRQSMVNRLLNRQLVVQSVEKRLNEAKPYLPYITFSREPGSGGKPIAREVARRLGYRFYDRKLIEKVAVKMKLSPNSVFQVDERKRNRITDLVQNLLNPDYISDETYFKNLVLVVLQLVHRGGVVILGRGANFIAPKAFGLQVQVSAPYRVRVARAIEFEKIHSSKAREIIRRIGDDRAGFVKQYIGKDILQPKYYDLTLNTAYFSVDAAVEVVLHAFKAKFPHGKLLLKQSSN